MTAAVEFFHDDCAVPGCEEVTVGYESPVMPGLTEDGELVCVTLQWCPQHASAFELVMSGFKVDRNWQRHSNPNRRYGYDLAVESLISA